MLRFSTRSLSVSLFEMPAVSLKQAEDGTADEAVDGAGDREVKSSKVRSNRSANKCNFISQAGLQGHTHACACTHMFELARLPDIPANETTQLNNK